MNLYVQKKWKRRNRRWPAGSMQLSSLCIFRNYDEQKNRERKLWKKAVIRALHTPSMQCSLFRQPYKKTFIGFFTLCVYVGPRENRLIFESWFPSSLNSAVFWKYLHVPFIKIWRQGAVTARVVDCGRCWWYGTAALVFCGRGHDGGRRGWLVARAGCWRGLGPLRRWLVNLHVFPEGAWVCVGFITHFAEIGFVRSMDVHVFLTVTAVRKAPVTPLKLTLERFFTGVCSFVNF